MKKITLLVACLVGLNAMAQIAGTSFEEPGIFGVQYVDTGDPAVAHDLVDNADEPFINWTSTGAEMGFDARYEPYDTPDVGLTDGDFVGVTDFTPGSGIPYTDGDQGYQISDADGNFILEFDEVDLTGVATPSMSIDYFLSETGYEGDGTVNESGSDRLRIYVKDLTNSTEIDILDTTGNDINDLGIEGAWITGSVNLVADSTVQLVIEVRCNAGSEAFFFDNLVFSGDPLSVDDVTGAQFAMYPNPTTDFITISSALQGEKAVAIFDVLGKEVINTIVADGAQLNIAELTSGIYIVQITEGNAVATKKLVVR
ncbi:MAG: T9SS type A sorting domain-containing protein [Bacteroidota bacterium]